jgi:hypothetical protein
MSSDLPFLVDQKFALSAASKECLDAAATLFVALQFAFTNANSGGKRSRSAGGPLRQYIF